MSLQTIIQQIKNASLPGENTALRVGSALEQMDAAKRDKTDSLSKAETIDMVNAAKLLAATGTPFLGTIDPATVIPAGNFWAFAGEGTYPNAGGIVVGAGEIAIITRVGAAFDSVILDVPVNSIEDIAKTSSVDNVDTYTITLTDGSTFDFEITNADKYSPVTLWEDFTSSDFPLPGKTQTIRDNVQYILPKGVTADVGDVPGVSDKWVSLGENITNITNITEEITQNITQQVIDPSSITLEPNYYNKSTAGSVEIASKLIKRIGIDSNQVLTYVEAIVNENGVALSDADLDDTHFFIKENNKYYIQIFPSVIDVRNLGLVAGQNCGAKFQKILDRFKNLGATFKFPAQEDDYIFEQQIIFPYSMINNTPTQKPFTLLGDGSFWNGKNIGNNGKKGSCIQLAYQGNGTYLDAKILSYGLGKITIKDITFQDLSGNNSPFFYSTYTTWLATGNAFLGSKIGILADQDVFVFGGTDETEIGDNPNGGFQGYGTIISNNYFNYIRRGVLGQNYFNANIISDNTFWFQCGNANGGAIEFISASSQSCTGNTITGNLVEMLNYKNFFKGNKANNNSFINNNLFDTATAGTSKSYYDMNDSLYNIIIHGWHEDKIPDIIGNLNQTVINGHANGLSKFERVQANEIVLPSANLDSPVQKSITTNVQYFTRYFENVKLYEIVRDNDDNSQDILFSIRDYNDGYFGYNLKGIDPRLDSENSMKIRVGLDKELFLGENGGKGLLLSKGGVRLQPQNQDNILFNSIFLDEITGKLSFKDSSGVVNPLY